MKVIVFKSEKTGELKYYQPPQGNSFKFREKSFPGYSKVKTYSSLEEARKALSNKTEIPK